MEYEKFDMDNYSLYTLKTSRFKTISLRVNIRIKDDVMCDKYLPMLWRMLINTSSKYDSIKEINRACAKVYDPYFGVKTIASGSESIISLSASFTNEKYTEKGMNEKSIKFLLPFLFEPKVIDGGFDNEIFEIQKAKLIDSYKSIKDYPRNYADAKLEELMISRDYKVLSLDEVIEETSALTNKELYEYYEKIMCEGKLDIFVCGNINPLKIKKIFEYNVIFKGNRKGKIDHIINQTTYNKDVNVVIEESNNVQSNLIVGCKALDITDFERNYVFILYSWILGGGMNSLLHTEVREKNSLCYYIYTVRDILRGVMKIVSGINASDFDRVYELIELQMKNICDGNFSSEILENVKNLYYNSLISIEDYQSDMTSNFVGSVYIGSDDIDVRRKMMEKVTKEDVMRFAKKVHIDTVFLLKGDNNE